MKSTKIEDLKIQLLEQLRTKGTTDYVQCEKLIAFARNVNDVDSLAIGHLWLAESFLHDEKKLECNQQLELVKKWIDFNQPTEILEKYYFIEYRLYSSLYDVQTAFEYCLKSLSIVEQLFEEPSLIKPEQHCFVNTIGNRIVGNYGNIGINFYNQGVYDKALVYCNKALDILATLSSVNGYAECLLRLNVVASTLKLKKDDQVFEHINLMMKIPVEAQVLKIYSDFAYVNYYCFKSDRDQIEHYVYALLNDEIEKHTDRMTAVDFYMDVLEPLIDLRMFDLVLLLFKQLDILINEEESIPLLKLTQLKIRFADVFNQPEKKKSLVKTYYDLYFKKQKMEDSLRISGLETRLKLNQLELENILTKNQIHVLEDIANYDELTHVFNRRYLDFKYQELLENAPFLLGLLILDVDYFKEYNDYYGHVAGDKILQKIAQCLKQNQSESMSVCRYGGDEFLVVVWEKEASKLNEYIAAIYKTIESMQLKHPNSACCDLVSISCGYGMKEIHQLAQIHSLFDEVDKALYIAKSKGRNQAVEI